MPKYFVNEDFSLNEETIHHLKRVLRIKLGDKIILCDGKGFDYHVSICNLNPLEFTVDNKIACNTELDYKITLYQALPKSDKLELIVQKSVELGVYEIVPIITEHCDARPNLNKINRYQKISESAAGQSMRGIIPKIYNPIKLCDAIQDSSKPMLVAHEKATANFLAIAPKVVKGDSLGIWVGPEGGFSQTEIELMEQSGFETFSLGPRILRTETAAIAAIAMLQVVIQ